MTVSEQKILEFADSVIDEFGFLLDDYEIVLPNGEKPRDKYKMPEMVLDNIYGTDYYRLENAILEHLKNYFEITKEE